MNSKDSIALSALTIGVGTAALLGVSKISEAGDDPQYCDTEWDHCYIGYYPELGHIHVYGYIYWAYYYQNYVNAVSNAMEAYAGYQYVYGDCRMQNMAGYPSEELFCGCGGEAMKWGINLVTYDYGYSFQQAPGSPYMYAVPLFDLHNSQCWYP